VARRDGLVLVSRRTRQNQPGPQCERLRRLAVQRQRHELLSLGIGQHQWRLRRPRIAYLVVSVRYTMGLRPRE
jgi:hypothetical protein